MCLGVARCSSANILKMAFFECFCNTTTIKFGVVRDVGVVVSIKRQHNKNMVLIESSEMRKISKGFQNLTGNLLVFNFRGTFKKLTKRFSARSTYWFWFFIFVFAWVGEVGHPSFCVCYWFSFVFVFVLGHTQNRLAPLKTIDH